MIKKSVLIWLFFICNIISFAQTIGSISGNYYYHSDNLQSNLYYYLTAKFNDVSLTDSVIFNLRNSTNGVIVEVELYSIQENITTKYSCKISNNQISIPFSSIKSGSYRIMLNGTPTNNYLLIENIETFNYKNDSEIDNLGLTFYLHTNEDYFPNLQNSDYNTVKSHVTNGWRKPWLKFSKNWNLCQDLDSNTIKNTNNAFNIYLYNHKPMRSTTRPSYYYHAIMENGKVNTDYDGTRIQPVAIGNLSLYLQSDLATEDSINKSLIRESDYYSEVISHEMLHVIQRNYIKSPPGNSKWLREGQARFLETVTMGEDEFRYNGKNLAMLNNVRVGGGLYEFDVYLFLKNILQLQTPDSLSRVSYRYCLFWRHLYEHNFASTTPIANRMAFLRETMKTNTSSNLDSIKTHMDAAFRNANGKFKTFDEAIIDFAQRVVFYNKSWKDSTGALLNNWEDPNGTDFYNTELQII
jgi:hypothetical protein